MVVSDKEEVFPLLVFQDHMLGLVSRDQDRVSVMPSRLDGFLFFVFQASSDLVNVIIC